MSQQVEDSDKQAPRYSYQKNEEHRFTHQMTRHLGHSLMGNIKSTRDENETATT